jgi:hypothetical protein
MVEAKIQSACIAWFRDEYVGSLIDNYLLKAEQAKYMRMLFHGNQNETPYSLIKKLPKSLRTPFERFYGKLTSMGLMAGVSDTSMKCMFDLNGKVYPYAEIEFKTKAKGSEQEPKQILYQEAVEYAGGYYIVIRSVEEFKEFINSITFVIP